MKYILSTSFITLFILLLPACSGSRQDEDAGKDYYVTLKTTMGDITFRLYNETPAHRDNFIRLAKEGFYDGVLFHRVIRDFMIQTGDPDSKHAAKGVLLGNGGPGYTIPAEIRPGLFHKKGAVAAARLGDIQNPERASSGSQFYIVQGRTFTDADLDQAEKRIDVMTRNAVYYHFVNKLKREAADSGITPDPAYIQQEAMMEATDSISSIAPYHFTPAQREVYKNTGGTPHLDGNYTVFGEVVGEMDVVDKIATVSTDKNDRPVVDVRILSVKISKK